MKAMLPAAVFCLIFGLLVIAVIGCNHESDDKKLGDVNPWGSNALNQMTGSAPAGSLLVSDGTKWHLLPIGTGNQVLTVTTNGNSVYLMRWQ